MTSSRLRPLKPPGFFLPSNERSIIPWKARSMKARCARWSLAFHMPPSGSSLLVHSALTTSAGCDRYHSSNRVRSLVSVFSIVSRSGIGRHLPSHEVDEVVAIEALAPGVGDVGQRAFEAAERIPSTFHVRVVG